MLHVLKGNVHGSQFLDQRNAEHRMNGMSKAVFVKAPGVSQPYTLDGILSESESHMNECAKVVISLSGSSDKQKQTLEFANV